MKAQDFIDEQRAAFEAAMETLRGDAPLVPEDRQPYVQTKMHGIRNLVLSIKTVTDSIKNLHPKPVTPPVIKPVPAEDQPPSEA
jgi:hypothetical protein